MRRQWILNHEQQAKTNLSLLGEGRSERDLAERVRKITGAFGPANSARNLVLNGILWSILLSFYAIKCLGIRVYDIILWTYKKLLLIC